MGFFSELKSDLSQAVNTLMPDDKADETRVLDKESVDGETVRAQDVDLDSMLDRLDEIILKIREQRLKKRISMLKLPIKKI